MRSSQPTGSGPSALREEAEAENAVTSWGLLFGIGTAGYCGVRGLLLVVNCTGEEYTTSMGFEHQHAAQEGAVSLFTYRHRVHVHVRMAEAGTTEFGRWKEQIPQTGSLAELDNLQWGQSHRAA